MTATQPKTVLMLLKDISADSKSLLDGKLLNQAILEDLRLVYESSIALHRRLEDAFNTHEKTNRWLLYEIRIQLNIIMGYTELILDGLDGDIPETQCHPLEKIRWSAMELTERLHETFR